MYMYVYTVVTNCSFFRIQDWTVGICDSGGKLAENDGLFWNRDVLLSAVIHVVHSDADQLLGIRDGSLQREAARLKSVFCRP